MIIGIHPDHIGKESYSEKWADFLRGRGVEVRMLNLRAPDVLGQVRGCNGVMWHWKHHPQDKQSVKRILHTIEHYLGIPVYPDTRTAWHYDEKIAQYYLLKALQAPMPQTWLFWDQEQVLQWASTAPYPVVFKLSVGAGSSNVTKVKNRDEAVTLINRAFNRGIFPYTMNEYRIPSGFPRTPSQLKSMAARFINAIRYVWSAEYPTLNPVHWRPERGYAYFQGFLPSNEFDTRVTVIGDRAFAFRRLNRRGDFRASGSGHIDYDPAAIDPRCIQIAFRISKDGGFQSMAYDFLYHQGQPVITEISYTYTDWFVHDCPGHWNSHLDWVKGNMWPEEAQVIDFIERIKSYK